jgi:hypothetical protein
LVRPDDGGIDQRADVIYFYLQFLEELFPDTASRPPSEPVVRGVFHGPIPLWDVAPRCAGLHPPKHGVDEVPVSELSVWGQAGAV